MIPHRFTLAAILAIAPSVVPAAEQPDPSALDPAVQTSPAPAPSPAPPAAPAGTRAAAPTAAPPPTPAQAPRPEPPKSAEAERRPAARGDARDRIELEATQITGNRELPRVMYVVPWKKADPGDIGGRPARSLLDEVLAPVDREVFRRENRYYDALQPDAAAGKDGR